jgi:RimJ/RimL family protein N-acetyltransferase
MLLFLETEKQLDTFLSNALASIDERPRLQWHLGVEDNKSGAWLGSCCLMLEAESPSSAELGYWFLREHWGYGFATEASQAMLEFGFRRLGLHRIWAKCHVRNEASAKILEKLGMTFEGTLREHVWLRDHFRSSRVYGILDTEYTVPPT